MGAGEEGPAATADPMSNDLTAGPAGNKSLDDNRSADQTDVAAAGRLGVWAAGFTRSTCA
jgi:hypothetical protein